MVCCIVCQLLNLIDKPLECQEIDIAAVRFMGGLEKPGVRQCDGDALQACRMKITC